MCYTIYPYLSVCALRFPPPRAQDYAYFTGGNCCTARSVGRHPVTFADSVGEEDEEHRACFGLL